MVRKKLQLTKLRLDGDTQPRAEIDQQLVNEYADAYKAGKKLPPVVVFNDGASRWLADGFHRWHGSRKAGNKQIECDERKGTLEDARWFSYAANQAHGQRRSNEDKRKAVLAALKHSKGAVQSDNAIAEYLGVSQPFVGKCRKELQPADTGATYNGSKSTNRTGSDGRTINTENIGKSRPPKPRQKPEPPPAAAEETGGGEVGRNRRHAVEQLLDEGETQIPPEELGALFKSAVNDLAADYLLRGLQVAVAAAVLENCAAEMRGR